MEKLIKALTAAQGEFPVIKKNRTGQSGNIKHDYADLATIVEHTRPICVKNKLCHVFTMVEMENKESKLVTTLYHESGEKIESTYPLGNLGSMKDKEAGIRISYAKRYSLKAILGVEEEKDPSDDGWGSEPRSNSSSNERGGAARQRNHAPGGKAKDKVTIADLKVLWASFEKQGFSKEQAAAAVQNEFKKKSVDLTKAEFKKMLDLVNSLGLSILDQPND